MTDPVFRPRLPVFGNTDGDQVVTSSGNVYEYNAEKNEWVCIGIIQNPEVVDKDTHGLVPPNVWRKLALIQELIEDGFDFSSFKLDTDVEDPYFYFFHSSDDLIKFTPEKCVDPKEVVARPKVAQVVANADDTTTIIFTGIFFTSFDGLTLETEGGNYKIASSTNTTVLLNESLVNIANGEDVKVVREENFIVKLRIEVDKGRLYQKLVRNCCVGPKGIDGESGDIGSAGEPAERELFQFPSNVTDGTFSWDTIVNTPLDTPISLRIFTADNDDLPIIEVRHPLDGSPEIIIINDETITVEETPFEVSYDPKTKKFRGSIVVSTGSDGIDTWRFKARQIGEKGNTGFDGKPFLEVITSFLDDPSIRSTDAILSLRKNSSNDIITFRNQLFTEVPVSNLSAPSGDSITNILEDNFTAVGVTIREAKDIGFYQFVPKPFEMPPLDIPLWTPTADCVQSRRWAQYRFDWFNRTEPDYLFSIIENPKPPEQCCVAGDTFIHCEDGLRRIKTLRVGDKVLCPDGKFGSIAKFYDNGFKECVKLTFSDGSEIVCTPDHKFPVGGELVEAQNLQNWDQIYKAPGVLQHTKENHHGDESDFDRGFAIGYLLGDGWITDSSIGIVAPEHEKDGFDRVYNIISNMFGFTKIQNRIPAERGCSMFTARWSSNKAKSYFLNAGWYKSLPEERIEIPDSVYTETFKFYCGFFSALINTDGSVTVDGINVDWSILKVLPQTIKRLIDYLGFDCSLLEQVRSENKFKKLSKEDRCHRIDLLQGSISSFIPLISEGLIEVKKERLKDYPSSNRDEIQLPVARVGNDYEDGLIAGSFIFSGGFNRKTRRAWINSKMPVGLRDEVRPLVGRPVKNLGSTFYKKADFIIDKIDNNRIDFNYALGFLRAAIYHRDKLATDCSFVINKNQKWEMEFVSSCLDALSIKHKIIECNTPFGNTQYRVVIKRYHHIYKLFCMTGHRNKLFGMDLGKPQPSTGIVVLKSREYVGAKHVYDYEVLPHYMMMAEGIMAVDCQEDFFFCPNVGDNPCGITGELFAPFIPVDCFCDCQSPIVNELSGGGLTFDPMNLVSEAALIDGAAPTATAINIIEELQNNEDGDPPLAPLVPPGSTVEQSTSNPPLAAPPGIAGQLTQAQILPGQSQQAVQGSNVTQSVSGVNSPQNTSGRGLGGPTTTVGGPAGSP